MSESRRSASIFRIPSRAGAGGRLSVSPGMRQGASTARPFPVGSQANRVGRSTGMAPRGRQGMTKTPECSANVRLSEQLREACDTEAENAQEANAMTPREQAGYRRRAQAARQRRGAARGSCEDARRRKACGRGGEPEGVPKSGLMNSLRKTDPGTHMEISKGKVRWIQSARTVSAEQLGAVLIERHAARERDAERLGRVASRFEAAAEAEAGIPSDQESRAVRLAAYWTGCRSPRTRRRGPRAGIRECACAIPPQYAGNPFMER